MSGTRLLDAEPLELHRHHDFISIQVMLVREGRLLESATHSLRTDEPVPTVLAAFLGQFYLGGFGNQLLENQEVKQFRDPLRFPGVPVFSLPAGAFGKVMLEHNLPPLRLPGARIGSHSLNHVDASWFAQGLVLDSGVDGLAHNLGAQVNLVFEHWSNLESTLSAGVARAWMPGGDSWEWFVSLKLLKN